MTQDPISEDDALSPDALQGMDSSLLTPEERTALAAISPPEPETDQTWYANLADQVDESTLGRIASKVIQWTRLDDESRADWRVREAKGIQMLGVSDTDRLPGATFEGASRVVHPVLAEAVIQFQARAIAELYPPEGPAKAVVLGDPTDELEAQATRVEDYLNYQYTRLMPGAFQAQDKLLFRLPLSGSCFKKVFEDTLEGSRASVFVDPQDMIVPYSAIDLRTAPRYTHRIKMSRNETLRRMAAGEYRQIDLPHPWEPGLISDDTLQQEVDSAEGREQTDMADDQRDIHLEMHVDYDLPGFEDVGPDGKETGIGLPYVITVNEQGQKVLAIRRNWKESDPRKRKRLWFVHYSFFPGLGFYGFGYLHVIGSLTEAATGSLRALLDSAQFANLQGGFRAADAKFKEVGEDGVVSPGEWIPVEMGADDLRKVFFPMPYKEPSETLIKLLGLLDEMGRRIASTAELLVGEANNAAPVGSTMALIEQGLKVYTAIHKRLHIAMGEELNLVASLNGEMLPETPYPYHVSGKSLQIMRADFDERVDVIPVSDPNVVLGMQRIAQIQAVMQLSTQAPDIYDRRAVHKRMLRALQIADPDEILPDKTQTPRMDPVSEGASAMMGKAIKAFQDQDHGAHLTVHQMQMQALPQPLQGTVGPALQAHIAEHYALAYMMQMIAQMDIMLPMPNAEEESQQPSIPPELDAMVSSRAALLVQQQMAAMQQAQQAQVTAQQGTVQ